MLETMTKARISIEEESEERGRERRRNTYQEHEERDA